VTGIFHGGTALEAGAVIMPLDQMQIIAGMEGKVTAFHVKLRPARRRIVRRVRQARSGSSKPLARHAPNPAAERAANNQIVALAHSVAWGTSSIALY
jgi:putative ABC transport system permease protein